MASFILQVITPPRVALTKVGQTLQSVTLATWAITCALTMLTTFLIILRIWMIERKSRAYIMPYSDRDNTLSRAIRIIMESGLLYAADMLVLLIVYSVGSNGAYPMTDTVPQVIGISFNLIIIRASKRHVNRNAETGTDATSVALTIPSRSEQRNSMMIITSNMVQNEVVLAKNWDRRRSDRDIELSPIKSR
ncbi:hypothetical protein K435DRAFT_338195 [Dendrothele bispora CBS 962.96]|uniref:Uncharacterized protein n=1 Tax=Dendrothele bispora (strain CBS 962.96) TaxID=1314807 RepID=A0A4S8MJK1_DENBC|nr:hypothetical protein K435DRAFT_338195 [Dendrothele bispora CBS 962.96]